MRETLKSIATTNGLSADDLIIVAEALEEYGEYLHACLIGYGADELRKCAAEMTAA